VCASWRSSSVSSLLTPVSEGCTLFNSARMLLVWRITFGAHACMVRTVHEIQPHVGAYILCKLPHAVVVMRCLHRLAGRVCVFEQQLLGVASMVYSTWLNHDSCGATHSHHQPSVFAGLCLGRLCLLLRQSLCYEAHAVVYRMTFVIVLVSRLLTA
jgi:hypothetical protein